VWRERSGLGFEIGVARLRMRGFRVLRKAMAVDRGALQWVPPYRPRRSERRNLLAPGIRLSQTSDAPKPQRKTQNRPPAHCLYEKPIFGFPNKYLS
jgi:hypothetical protein